MNTFIFIIFVVTYILWGFTLFCWYMGIRATKRNAIKRMQRWNDLIANELLMGTYTQTEIAQFIMKRSELLDSELPENEITYKFETLKIMLNNCGLRIKLFFKRIRNKILYFYFQYKLKKQ